MIAPYFDTMADAWANGILRASWQGGIAIALVWSVCAIATFIIPRIRCWLWRLAGMKLIVALVWSIPLALPLLAAQVPSVMPSHLQASISLPQAPPIDISAPSAKFVTPPTANFTPPVISQPSLQPAQSVPVPVLKSDPIHWQRILFLAWIVGVVIGIFRMAMSLRTTQRMRGDAIPVTEEHILASLHRMCGRMAIPHPPSIAICADIIAPVLIGPFRAIILIPDSKFSSAEEFDMALAHELAHFRRRDLFWSTFDALIGVLFFFHPLVWLLRRESAQCADAACDAEALAATDFDRQTYARLLLDLADNHAGILPGGFAMLGMIQTFGSLKKRLGILMNARPGSRRSVLISGLLIAALAIPGLIPIRLVPRAAAADPAMPPAQTGPATEPSQEDLEVLSALAGIVPVDQLPSPTKYQFHRPPLIDAIQALANAMHEKIQVDWGALNEHKIYQSTLVTLDGSHSRFSNCLQMILDVPSGEPGKFTFAVANGEIKVTATDRITSGIYKKVYDVHDLVRLIPPNVSKEAFEYVANSKLLEDIKSVDPQTWHSNNDNAVGRVDLRDHELIITQTAAVHREVAMLLQKLRGGVGGNSVADDSLAANDVFQQNLNSLNRLDQKVPKIQFDATALSEILGGGGGATGHGFLSDITGIPFEVNWAALQTIDVDKTTPITLKAENITLLSVLDEVLKQATDKADKWNFIVEDGSIVISTTEGLKTATYEAFDDFKEESADDPFLLKLIQDARDYISSHSAIPATQPTPLSGIERQPSASSDATQPRSAQEEASMVLVTRAIDAETKKDLTSALSLYQQAVEADSGNGVAAAGRDRMRTALGLLRAGKDASELQSTATQIGLEHDAIQSKFNLAINGASKALASQDYQSARDKIANAATEIKEDPDVFNTEEIAAMNSAVAALNSQLQDGEQVLAAPRYSDPVMRPNEPATHPGALSDKDREHAISSLIQVARTYQQQKDYTGMLGVLDQILALDPKNEYAAQMRPTIEKQAYTQEQKKWRERFDAQYMKPASTQPVAPSTPEQVMQQARVIQEYLQREREQAKQAVQAKMDHELPKVQFDAVPLADVINFLQDATGETILVNWNALDVIKVGKTTPITMSASNIKLDKVLRLVLDQAAGELDKIDYGVSDGIIEISSEEDMASAAITKVYDIRDLLVLPAPGEDKDKAALQISGQLNRIEKHIEATIYPQTWKANNPSANGYIDDWNESLIITQTLKVHDDVEALLKKLHTEATTKPADGAAPLR